MIGQTISHYKILEKLGEGGMGVVYKAQDTKLDRFVALKFLPPHLAASEQDKSRFIQEAKSASALNHPNVCTIHDIQEHDGQLFIVMEFVDGKTLQEQKHNLSQKQALDIGIQIADGLAAAHEKGIVHRDIKPENIMIRKDGIVQIMDFGLAKLRGASRLTKEGSTVGTAGYMSPEQVQGLDADHRSDIFSLGVLLFEMLSGQPPFKGVHETAIAYEIVNVDSPPLSSIKPNSPPELDAIVLECLEKDPKERTQSASQVSVDLKRFRRESSRTRASRITAARPIMMAPEVDAAQPIAQSGTKKQSFLPWIVAGIFGAATLVVTALYVISTGQETQTIRAFIQAPVGSSFAQQSGGASGVGQITISPDGRKIAFIAVDSTGMPRLYVRSLNSLIGLPLPGTENAFYPFWSPKSDFIAFFVDGKLKKIDASGGPPLSICDVREARGGSWGENDIIVFTPGANDPIFQVPAAGGTPVQVTKLDSVLNEVTHRFPWFLPDGKHFLYFARISSGSDEDRVCVGSLDGTPGKKLINTHSNAIYANGYLLFVREQTLVAQPFDADDLSVNGNAVPIAEQLRFSLNWNRGSFSASESGVLIYEGGLGPATNQLAMFDRTGKNVVVMKGTQSVFEASFSPDMTKIAFSSVDPQRRNEDIWVYDLARSISTRLTFDQKDDTDPIWSPDGKRIVFSSNRSNRETVLLKNADGTGSETELLTYEKGLYPTGWSRDGAMIACTTYPTRDIVVFPADGKQPPVIFLNSDFVEDEARFSPDGKFLAYCSNESGQREIYVRPFPGPGGKWQVSTSGSLFRAFWRRDGKEIYYQSRDGKIMAAEVNASGGTFSVGNVRPLFEAAMIGISAFLDVSPDGQEFLMVYNLIESKSDHLTMVLNWNSELKH
ncbi:MAG: serine/threonine-protein kinase [Ignavibacteriales bacterium]|nr:serine/threonine-protein kinase [Ignavibacteriales bacterium]